MVEFASDKHFGGRSNWQFVTKANKHESVVISRMKRKSSRIPWFQNDVTLI